MNKLVYGRGICYSGYRKNQYPGGNYPSIKQTLEDLKIIVASGYSYIRMYGPCPHSFLTCQIIKDYSLPLKVMLGLGPIGEIANPKCPWDRQNFGKEESLKRRKINDKLVEKLIEMAHIFQEEIFCLSVGNENTPEWSGCLISEERLISFAKKIKSCCKTLLTFNEGAMEWKYLAKLSKYLDIISIHSYPQWHKIKLEDAISYNIHDFNLVSSWYPNKIVMFTEFGWTTQSNSTEMICEEATIENQKKYYESFYQYFEPLQVISFAFEAFDEPWKGGQDAVEPEKHWGLFDENRKKKKIGT